MDVLAEARTYPSESFRSLFRPILHKTEFFRRLCSRHLHGRQNRMHVILSQTLREWTRFNVEE
jgi:hypothetical protein